MNIISIDHVKVGYESNIVIEDLSLNIKKGAITTIIGENGCGKSTLLKAIGRILKVKQGDIFVGDLNVHKTSTKEIAQILGMLPQSPKAPNGLCVEEIVEYGRYPHKKKRNSLTKEDHEIVDWALKQTDLEEFRARNINSLSGGQRQRVWIAMVLAQQTDIILLDEPTTYLDMAYQLEVLQLVKALNVEKGMTVVMVLHDINQASRFSDDLVMLRKGAIVTQGTPREVMTNENLRTVFDIDAHIMTLPNSDIPVCISYELLRCEESNPCRFLPTDFPLSCRNPLVNTPVFPAVLSFARNKSEGKNCVAPISLRFLWALGCEGGSLAGARRRRQSQKHQKGLMMGDSGSTPRTLVKGGST